MQNKEAVSSRKIKIQPKYLDYGTRKSTPQFLLSGLWLEQAGFRVGAMVEISVRYKELVIKILSAPEIGTDNATIMESKQAILDAM